MKKQLEEKDEDDLTWAEFSGIIGKKLKLIHINLFLLGLKSRNFYNLQVLFGGSILILAGPSNKNLTNIMRQNKK